MSTDEATALWAEIDEMREELKALRVRRTLLHNHLEKLMGVGAELEVTHSKIEEMAQEVREHLEGKAS